MNKWMNEWLPAYQLNETPNKNEQFTSFSWTQNISTRGDLGDDTDPSCLTDKETTIPKGLTVTLQQSPASGPLDAVFVEFYSLRQLGLMQPLPVLNRGGALLLLCSKQAWAPAARAHGLEMEIFTILQVCDNFRTVLRCWEPARYMFYYIMKTNAYRLATDLVNDKMYNNTR